MLDERFTRNKDPSTLKRCENGAPEGTNSRRKEDASVETAYGFKLGFILKEVIRSGTWRDEVARYSLFLDSQLTASDMLHIHE